MKTSLYVDGFNLYYGALRNTRYRWLDVRRMGQLLLPRHQITRIKYFTANIGPRPNDPHGPVRQQTYLRALRTIPELEIISGRFLTHEVGMPLAGCPPEKQRFARVIKTEEKGSDVNIATHLLIDGFRGDYEVAVVVSNDSDLLEPIKFVQDDLGKPVGILNPRARPSKALLPHVTFYKRIRQGVLKDSQFPNPLTDKHGTIHKPATW